jgi:dTMP kinase
MPAADMTAGCCWISVEGLNGVGKTYLTGRLAARLGDSCRLLSELTDHGTDQVTGQVIAALTRGGRTFLRTGHPITETFALLALKVHEYERLTSGPGQPAGLVLEDRGPDTVAVYQAAILARPAPSAAAELVGRILTAASIWRPPPTRTVLLVDDLDACIGRFAARLGEAVDPADRDLLVRVDTLYRDLAAAHADRIQIIDRTGRPEGDVLDEMESLCHVWMREASLS